MRVEETTQAEGGLRTYLVFAAGAVGASWGLTEIFLTVDPFLAFFFKWAWLATIGIVAIVFGGVLGALAPLCGVSILILLGAAAALARVFFPHETLLVDLAGLLRALWPPEPDVLQMRNWPAPGVAALLLAAAVATAARGGRWWFRRHFDPPMVVAVLLVGVFAFFLSVGRAQEIDRRDIALEELRDAGMRYELSSLQAAIFFVNDRGARLYRQAGFELEDFFLAFGRTSDEFSPGGPLLYAALTRLEEDAAAGDRADRFAAMLTAIFAPQANAADPAWDAGARDAFARPFHLYDADKRRCASPPAPLFAHLVKTRALRTAAAIWRPDPGVGDAESAARAGQTPPLGIFGSALTAETAAPPEVDGSQSCHGGAGVSLEQAHLHALVGPVFALQRAAARSDGRGAAAGTPPLSELEALCAVAEGMTALGAPVSSFVDRSAITRAVQAAGEAEGAAPEWWSGCEAALAYWPEIRAETPPVLISGAQGRSGYLVARDADAGDGCAVDSLTTGPLGVCGPQGCVSGAEEPAGLVWRSELRGELGGAPIRLSFAQLGDQARVLFWRPGADVQATDWFDAPARSAPLGGAGFKGGGARAPWLLGGRGALMVLGAGEDASAPFAAWLQGRDAGAQDHGLLPPPESPPAASVQVTSSDAPASAVIEPAPAARLADAGGAAEGGKAFTADLKPGDAPQIIRFALDESIGPVAVEASVETTGDICLQYRDLRTGAPIAARFVPGGEAAALSLSQLAPADSGHVAVFAWLARAEPAQVALRLQERAIAVDAASCPPTAEGALSGLAANWTALPTFRGELAGGAEAYCRFQSDAAYDVALRLEDLVADVDIEVLYRGAGLEEFIPVASSFNLGVEDEAIAQRMSEGDYLVRIYNTASEPSSYAFTVVDAQPAAPMRDVFGPNTLETAEILGRLESLGDALLVEDAIDRVDPESGDWYAIDVAARGVLAVRLDGLAQDLDVDLRKADGAQIGVSVAAETEAEFMTAEVDAGRHYVRIHPISPGQSSPYALEVALKRLGGEALGALAGGATFAATDALSDDAPVAAYSFTLDAAADVRIALDGLEQDADIFLSGAAGEIALSANSGVESEAIEARLDPGAYRLSVRLFRPGETPFRLSIARP